MRGQSSPVHEKWKGFLAFSYSPHSSFDCSESLVGCINDMREISFQAMCRPFGKHKRYAAAIEVSHNEWFLKVAKHVICSDSNWKHYGNSSSNNNNNNQKWLADFVCNISVHKAFSFTLFFSPFSFSAYFCTLSLLPLFEIWLRNIVRYVIFLVRFWPP